MPVVLRPHVDLQEVLGYYRGVVSEYWESQPPNPDLIDWFSRLLFTWDEIEIGLEELELLETPARQGNRKEARHLLLSELRFEDVAGGLYGTAAVPVRSDLAMKMGRLQRGESVGHLIVRDRMFKSDLPGSSFYIEDGFGKALAIKKYLSEGGFSTVPAYRAKISDRHRAQIRHLLAP